MNREACDLLIEVDKHEAAVRVLLCGLRLHAHAALLEESDRGVYVMAADRDVALLARAVLLHDLDEVRSEDGAVADSRDEAHEGLELVCDSERILLAVCIDTYVQYAETELLHCIILL